MTELTDTAALGGETGVMELTEAAKQCLDDYLASVRSSLRYCPSVDVADVERDVMEHIQHALAGTALAVDEPELRQVLRRLGSPSQWVPREESSDRSSWLRRAVMTLRSGPEDMRLAYMAFGLLVQTFFLAAFLNLWMKFGAILPFFLLWIGVSFVVARASLSLVGEFRGPERWLIYPSLLVVYLPVLAAIFLIPVAMTVGVLVFLIDPGAPRSIRTWATILIGLLSISTFWSFWWGILGFVAWRWPAVVRDGFAPFAKGFRRRGFWLGVSVLCLMIFVVCAAVWAFSIWRHIRDLERPVAMTPVTSAGATCTRPRSITS
jgi:hypothetical protein